MYSKIYRLYSVSYNDKIINFYKFYWIKIYYQNEENFQAFNHYET